MNAGAVPQASSSEAPPIFDNSAYRRLVARPLARRLAPLLDRCGLSANGIGWMKFVIGMAGAGMLLLQGNFLLDAADGEVARLRGEAGKLSGEYLDKLFDHFPKTAMYFLWGYGTFRLTGSHLPLFAGMLLGGWSIYPRFCGVETLLERLDKAPRIYEKPAFHQAVARAFVTSRERGRADFLLTIFAHPAMNLLTVFFLLEILLPTAPLGDGIPTRALLLGGYTLASLANLIRKSARYFRTLDFS